MFVSAIPIQNECDFKYDLPTLIRDKSVLLYFCPLALCLYFWGFSLVTIYFLNSTVSKVLTLFSNLFYCDVKYGKKGF